MKVEVTVLGSPSLIILMVSVDVKQHERRKTVKRTSLARSGYFDCLCVSTSCFAQHLDVTRTD